MPAYRCSPCGLNWPPNKDYVKCLQCGEKTSHMAGSVAMSQSDANHTAFDAFYADREAQRLAADLDALEAVPEAA